MERVWVRADLSCSMDKTALAEGDTKDRLDRLIIYYSEQIRLLHRFGHFDTDGGVVSSSNNCKFGVRNEFIIGGEFVRTVCIVSVQLGETPGFLLRMSHKGRDDAYELFISEEKAQWMGHGGLVQTAQRFLVEGDISDWISVWIDTENHVVDVPGFGSFQAIFEEEVRGRHILTGRTLTDDHVLVERSDGSLEEDPRSYIFTYGEQYFLLGDGSRIEVVMPNENDRVKSVKYRWVGT